MIKFSYYFLLLLTLSGKSVLNSTEEVAWDDAGYLFYCPCMGRFGNQAAHFLGSLAFSKELNRTLILHPWRTYKNVPFNEFFEVEPLKKFHKVILADDFMQALAPKYWPPGKRKGFCYVTDKTKTCQMKGGNPFTPFWDELGIDFDEIIPFTDSYRDTIGWKKNYPPEKFPVIALRGAPAAFPVEQSHRYLQKYLQWSSSIQSEVDAYLKEVIRNSSFIGLHLRNGPDWENACKAAVGLRKFMESGQCLENKPGQTISSEMCLPSFDEVKRLITEALDKTKSKAIFIATDKNPLLKELEKEYKNSGIQMHHLDPWLPQTDLAILEKSTLFIGNCVSSFSAFVKRARDAKQKPTWFFGFTKGTGEIEV